MKTVHIVQAGHLISTVCTVIPTNEYRWLVSLSACSACVLNNQIRDGMYVDGAVVAVTVCWPTPCKYTHYMHCRRLKPNEIKPLWEVHFSEHQQSAHFERTAYQATAPILRPTAPRAVLRRT
jgi:hypothetical protein